MPVAERPGTCRKQGFSKFREKYKKFKSAKIHSWMGLFVTIHHALLITCIFTGNFKVYTAPVCCSLNEKGSEQSFVGLKTIQKQFIVIDHPPDQDQLEVEYFAANSKLANTLPFVNGCKLNLHEIPYGIDWGDVGEEADPTKSTIMYENWFIENLLRDYALYKDQDAAALPFDDIALDYKAVFGSTFFVWSF